MEDFSYDTTNTNIIDRPEINIYLTETLLVDEDTTNTLINILNRIYFNNLLVLFLMSSMATLYVCRNTRKHKDYIMINTIEPKLIKGEIIHKV
jgi:hypothetical protein